MKKKQIIGGAIALLAIYGLYKVFSKPKAVASGDGSEAERQTGPIADGGGIGGSYGGGYSGGYGQPSTGGSTTSSTTASSGTSTSGSSSSTSSGPVISMPSKKYVTNTYQPTTTVSQPRTNPYINTSQFNTVRDTKSSVASMSALANKIKSATSSLQTATPNQPKVVPRITAKF